MSKQLLFLNGPNLNLLGVRNQELYGSQSLGQITDHLKEIAKKHKFSLLDFQSNSEAELIGRIHECRISTSGMLINPGGYSHTSIALRDAIECYPAPVIEVHLSNIFQREKYRNHSFVSEVARGVICGLGPYGYELGLLALMKTIENKA